MVDWTYNEIDVYLSASDNILGETSVNTASWVPLSTYGLLRSRVALTPSTVEGNAITIPSRDGKTYSTDSGRGNAKLEFEVLIADEWVHRLSETTASMTVRQRADMVAALLNNTRRIAYKQPGRTADSYFMVYKTTLTFQDADEKAFVIKAQMEVHPFEFYLTGNAPISVAAGAKVAYQNPFPNSECRPTYTITDTQRPSPTTFNIALMLDPNDTSTIYDTIIPAKTVSAGTVMVVDSFLQLVYNRDTKANMNDHIQGDMDNLKFLQGQTIYIFNNATRCTLTVYPRGGIKR